MVHPAEDVVLNYTYDDLNRVDKVYRASDLTTNGTELIDYDYTGQYLTRRRLTTQYQDNTDSNCVHIDLDFGHDEHRRIDSIANTNGPQTTAMGSASNITTYEYEFDKAGNRLNQAVEGRYTGGSMPLARDVTYSYDGLHRVTQASYAPNEAEDFRYDLLCNRDGDGSTDYGYSDTRTGGVNIAYGENNEVNEYSMINSNSILYDSAGNLVLDEEGLGYDYDFENRLVEIFLDTNSNGTRDSGETILAEYDYDALGRRIASVIQYDRSGIYGQGPVETWYLYDGQNVIEEYKIEEYNSNGDRQRYYVHGAAYIDERAVMHDDDEPNSGADAADYYYLLKDLYTVVGLANMQGHEVERYIYDTYGKVTLVSVLVEDLDFDGVVGGLDAAKVVAAWLQSGCVAGPIYDINGDGTVAGLDLSRIYASGTWLSTNTEIPASGVGNPYYFTGRRLDFVATSSTATPKQVYHYRARSYDPVNGRFRQRDPLGTMPVEGSFDYSRGGPRPFYSGSAERQYWDGMNLYQFVLGSPTRLVDPAGLQTPMPTSQPTTSQPSEPCHKILGCRAQDKEIPKWWPKKVAPGNDHSFATGKEFLEILIRESKDQCCIKKLVVFSHAWRYRSSFGGRVGGGFPGGGPTDSGFYGKIPVGEDGKRKLHPKARDLSDLEALKSKGKVRFCEPCKITFTGCRVGSTGSFVSRLARISGCSITAAHGACSGENPPRFTSGPGSSKEKEDGQYDGFTITTPDGKRKKIGSELVLW
jgi:RHS repeat-associated protein